MNFRNSVFNSAVTWATAHSQELQKTTTVFENLEILQRINKITE